MAGPEKKFRIGAVSATIWKNKGKTDDGKESEYRTVAIQRNYKDKATGGWKTTDSFRVSDLPKLRLVVDKAYEYLVLKEEGDGDMKSPSSNPIKAQADKIVFEEVKDITSPDAQKDREIHELKFTAGIDQAQAEKLHYLLKNKYDIYKEVKR